MKLIVLIIAGLALFVASTFVQLKSKTNDDPENNQNSLRDVLGINEIEKSFNKLLSDVQNQENQITLKGEDRDQINFLFLGIGGEEHISGNYLTDTLILITLIPSTQKISVISIPRDLMVRSPDKKYFTRINALYSIPKSDPSADPDPHGDITQGFPGPMGVEYTKEAVLNITGVEVDYYAVLDLAGVEKIVDILGGINVRRFEDLTDDRFPDDNAGYEIYEINEGWRYLNGEEAAKYIRTRHTSGGDFDRMKRQQDVALAIKRKVSGLQSLSGLPRLLSLYGTLQDHFTTDLAFNEIMHLMDIGGNTGSATSTGSEPRPAAAGREGIVFERITAEKDGLLVPDTVIWGGQRAAILKPRAGEENYEEIQAKVAGIINTLKN